MARGKNNARIRSHMGDNGHFIFGDPAAWEQFGKSNRWALKYELESDEAPMADKTTVNMPGIRKATLEIDLAQTHPEEMALVDLLRNSPSIGFWGDAGVISGENMEVHIPELVIAGVTMLETPASSGNMKIELALRIQPQAAVFETQDVDLPTVSNHGGTPVESQNEFFNYFVAIPD